MIQLYGIAGSRALRPLWALEEVGVAYELVPTNFMGDNKQAEYLKLNPNGRIPTLVDGSFVLFESMAINLYIAKKYGAAVLQPKSLEDEARAVQWSFWVMTECEPHLIQIMLHKVMMPEAMRKPEVVKTSAEALDKPLRVLDAALAGRETLLGGAFDIADLNVASVLGLANVGQFDLSPWPNVKRWMGTCLARPAFARALAKK
jgi:glutathione S-transferase